jgi:hypothetical protein
VRGRQREDCGEGGRERATRRKLYKEGKGSSTREMEKGLQRGKGIVAKRRRIFLEFIHFILSCISNLSPTSILCTNLLLMNGCSRKLFLTGRRHHFRSLLYPWYEGNFYWKDTRQYF